MWKKLIEEALISSAVEGGKRTISGNGKDILENSVDALFERGDKAIDDFFDPLIKIGGLIDGIFGL